MNLNREKNNTASPENTKKENLYERMTSSQLILGSFSRKSRHS